MRRTIILVAALIALGPAAGAIANYSGPTGNGTYHGMSGSSAGASAGVTEGDDGGEVLWRADVAQTGSSCRTGNATGIQDINWNTTQEDGRDGPSRTWSVVAFTGTVTTSTPCRTVHHDVVARGNGTFVLNVTTEATSGVCVDCIGAVSYSAEFRAPGDYRLSVMHGGDLVEVMDSPGNRGGERTHQSVVSRLIGLVLGLLGA